MKNILSIFSGSIGIVGGFLFLGIGLAQLIIGFGGIDYHLGPWFAWGSLALFFLLRFTIPITIGTYFGAVDVWGLPWWLGLLIAVPGIVLMFPALIMGGFDSVREKFK